MTKSEHYLSIFQKECRQSYPEIDEFEKACGFVLKKELLEAAAWPLACPLKVNPPSWQHGRILYSKLRQILQSKPDGVLVDIGTAKGFSAVVMCWACEDSTWQMPLTSVDVVDPFAKVPRNSYREADGQTFSVFEFTQPFIEGADYVDFRGCGSVKFLHSLKKGLRIPFAFVDGKHDRSVVIQESRLIRERQQRGDVTVFDDLQIPQVAQAVKELSGYSFEYLTAGFRKYAVATRT